MPIRMLPGGMIRNRRKTVRHGGSGTLTRRMMSGWLQNVPQITDNLSNMLSWYGSVSYSYGNLFTVNANVRYDGSNQFGERSNDKLLPIWSASFTYNVDGAFYRVMRDWFDDLRSENVLRVSREYAGRISHPWRLLPKNRIDDHYGEYVSTITTYPNPAFEVGENGIVESGSGVFHVSASFDGGAPRITGKRPQMLIWTRRYRG